MRTVGCEDISIPFTWAKVKLHIDLSQLSTRNSSAELLLPAHKTDVRSTVIAFCSEQTLPGQRCRELHYEVTNYLTSLYARPKGVTLRNMFAGMYFQEDLDYMYVYARLAARVETVLFRSESILLC